MSIEENLNCQNAIKTPKRENQMIVQLLSWETIILLIIFNLWLLIIMSNK